MDLTYKEINFICFKGCGSELNLLKQKLVSALILRVLSPTLDTEVWCKASSFAVCAAFVQY